MSTKKNKPEAANKNQKQKKDPNAPKRNKSAYTYFCSSVRPSVVEENPSSTPQEILAALGAKWKVATAEEKRPFEMQAADDKDRYLSEMKGYTPPSGCKGKSSVKKVTTKRKTTTSKCEGATPKKKLKSTKAAEARKDPKKKITPRKKASKGLTAAVQKSAKKTPKVLTESPTKLSEFTESEAMDEACQRFEAIK